MLFLAVFLTKNTTKTQIFTKTTNISDKCSKNNAIEQHDVIKEVKYIRWDNPTQTYVDRKYAAKNFAIELHRNDFKAKAGLRVNNNFKDLVDVIAFEQDDGEIWIKTKPDHTKRNNFENLLEYAKFYGFADKE